MGARRVIDPDARQYSTWMFRSAHMSLRICGHTVTDTSPKCAFLRIDMYVRS